eukprot:758883-Hanusia_phi.AAC.4
MDPGTFVPYGKLQQELARPLTELVSGGNRGYLLGQADGSSRKSSVSSNDQFAAVRNEFGKLMQDLYYGNRDPEMEQVCDGCEGLEADEQACRCCGGSTRCFTGTNPRGRAVTV